MGYSIGTVAEKVGLTAHTVRFYDKEGLLPFVERTPSGQRRFKESDLEWFAVIHCLKNTGMSIKDIKKFIDWCMEGDATLEKRLDMFLHQRELVMAQMAELQMHMDKINCKISYYETAVAAGTEAIHKCLPCE
ncbi:MAG: MerR family transcriptional regulator [Herbinix sp.]|jgi:DNA-binding transcriptional MerR regulator|nr:MerR family transcriptional regulator [Herbinix sp.]